MLKLSIFSILLGILFLFISFITQDSKEQIVKNENFIKDSKPCFFVQVESLNVREEPNLDSKILKKLKRDEKICSYEALENGFLSTKDGYVFAKYLHLTKKEKSLEIPQRKLEIPQEIYISLESKEIEKSKFTIKSKTKEENIKLAKLALASKDYKKAKSLALKLNKEDPSDLLSWEIFVKSVYLEGNEQEAILILQNFLQTNKSDKLLELLEKMQSGKSFDI
ncbi:MAG: SH3 domain-containing protein [Helicobacter sp.]|nr:SH3 domain-containing protein [Helicobacteraceae bacterium]MDY3113379.1 SH3 domain-containing protein [Helicobacter sp.]